MMAPRYSIRSRLLPIAAVAFAPASLDMAQAMDDNAAPQTGEQVDRTIGETKDRLAKWVEAKRALSKEQADWLVAEDMLKGRIAMMEREVAAMGARIAEVEVGVSDADREREALVATRDALASESEAVVARLSELEQRTRAIVARLPDPIRAKIGVLAARIPADSGGSSLSPAVRFQNVIGVLNEINKFNREITVVSEVRVLEDGRSAEVTAIYLGLGQGFYVNGAGTVAGIGTATPTQWRWIPRNEAAQQIQSFLSILKNERPAAFVSVPAEVE